MFLKVIASRNELNKSSSKTTEHPFDTFGPLVSYCVILLNKKNTNFVGTHLMNIPTKFGSNWPSGFREED